MKIWALAFAVCFIGIVCVKAEDGANPKVEALQELQELQKFDQALEKLKEDIKGKAYADVESDAEALEGAKVELGDNSIDQRMEATIAADVSDSNFGKAEQVVEELDEDVHARELKLSQTLALQSTDTNATTSDTTTEAPHTTEVLNTTAAPEAAPQDDDLKPNPEAESNAATAASTTTDETTTTEATTTTTTTTTTLAETTTTTTTLAETTPAATTPAATTRATTTTRAATTRARITKTKAATTTPTAAATTTLEPTTLEPTTQAAETTTPRADTSSPTASQSSESDWLLNAGEPLDSSTDGESDGGSGTSLLVIFFILVLIGAGLFFRRPIQKYVAQLTGKDTRYKRLPVRA